MPPFKPRNAAYSAHGNVMDMHSDDHMSRDQLLAALEEYRTRFHDIVEGSLQGMMVTRGPMPIFVNQTFANMFGYTADEVTALDSWEQLVAPEDRARVLDICASRARGEAAPAHYEYRAMRKDGSLFWLENLTRRVTWDGAPAVQATVIDVTARKEFETGIIAAKILAEKANLAKSEFLATMTHEFRTPLNAIIGFSDLLRSDTLSPTSSDAVKDYAEDIHSSGQLMLSLVNDVLDMAAIESGKRELSLGQVDIDKAMAKSIKTIETVAHNKGVTVSLETPGDIPSIGADERAVTQVLHNLLSNAVKFTGRNGRVILSVNVAGDAVSITISDTGDGIPADMIDRVTEPFVQIQSNPHVSENGTGLGLGIVKSLMTAHGGSLRIESEVGNGTRATVTFPR